MHHPRQSRNPKAAELLDPDLTADAAAAAGHVDRILKTSQDRLKMGVLDTVLLHNFLTYQVTSCCVILG